MSDATAHAGAQLRIVPEPTDEEVAAIAASLGALEARSAATEIETDRRRSVSWRFSTRWWVRPVALRRGRPR